MSRGACKVRAIGIIFGFIFFYNVFYFIFYDLFLIELNMYIQFCIYYSCVNIFGRLTLQVPRVLDHS